MTFATPSFEGPFDSHGAIPKFAAWPKEGLGQDYLKQPDPGRRPLFEGGKHKVSAWVHSNDWFLVLVTVLLGSDMVEKAVVGEGGVLAGRHMDRAKAAQCHGRAAGEGKFSARRAGRDLRL